MPETLVIEVIEGPATGRSTTVKDNDVLTVGRSAEAGLSLSVDIEISNIHFEVSSQNSEFRIRDLNSTNGTFVNGKAIIDEIIHDGDRIRAGQSFISVRIDPEETVQESKPPVVDQIPPADVEGDLPPAETDEDGFLALTAREIAIPIQFDSEESQDLLQADHSPKEYLETLTSQKVSTEEQASPEKLDAEKSPNLSAENPSPMEPPKTSTDPVFFPDALRFLAYALPKRQSVWWAIVCVRFGYGVNLTPQDLFILQEAENWVADPTDENRRAAMAATEIEESATAVSWPAIAAFWSSGSLAPPDSPPVPPGDDLTGKAVTVAETLAAVAFEPERAARKWQTFIELGIAVAKGELMWDEPSPEPSNGGKPDANPEERATSRS